MPEVLSRSTPQAAAKEVNYVPIREFFEQSAYRDGDNPYTSTFSFAPFIEKMRERKSRLHAVAPIVDSDFLEAIKEKLIDFSEPARLNTPEKRQDVINLLFPSLFFEGQLGFVAQPFTKDFFYMTPALQDIFTSTEWELKICGHLLDGKMGSPALEAGKLILNTFHGQNIQSNSYETMTFRHKGNGLERYYKARVVLDYIKVTPLNELKPLEEEQIFRLYNEWHNEAYWLEHFPPEDYAFEGLVIGFIEDVTEAEVLSEFKARMLSEEEEQIDKAVNIRQSLNHLIRSYLQMPDIEFGSFLHQDFKYASLFSWSLLGDTDQLAGFLPADFEQGTTYANAMGRQEPVIICDLGKIENPTQPEQRLLELGYRSLLLFPLEDRQGHAFGLFELASPEAYRFHSLTLDKLREVLGLFTAGTKRWIQSMDNNVNFFIQKQFTYIHPSVEWKFVQISQRHIFSAPGPDGRKPPLEPILFKQVYPLYGQADIVGSSQLRNKSIQADMLDNLKRVSAVLKDFSARLSMQLLEVYLAKVEAFSRRLESGGFISSDESQVVELLTLEVHPLLRELSDQYEHLPKEKLRTYLDYLDPKLDIVYRRRKAYEDSVQELNDMISGYLEQEVAKKQEVLPHFFEKYITDGVEYNIYLGQSILESGKFSSFFLKDFRLWQLIQMCEITRLVEEHGQQLLVPLSTAQLIFVYNNPLSIRFNMDEKQFDVDGAYNVRYEILKKRIDKALIKGSSERLTQRGKVAMVWLQDKDRAEYLEYLEHLQQQGYITDEIEELELERLQGADGLKALRATVVL